MNTRGIFSRGIHLSSALQNYFHRSKDSTEARIGKLNKILYDANSIIQSNFYKLNQHYSEKTSTYRNFKLNKQNLIKFRFNLLLLCFNS